MALRDKLQGDVLRAVWPDLVPPMKRGALVWVQPDIDILDVGVALAEDDADTIAAWLESGAVVRIEAPPFEGPPPDFQVLIVQPFVIAQPILS